MRNQGIVALLVASSLAMLMAAVHGGAFDMVRCGSECDVIEGEHEFSMRIIHGLH